MQDVVLLTTAGLQVPVIPLVEVVGNTGAVEPTQNAGIAANVGVTWLVMVISIVVVVPHWLASGVKVYVVVPNAVVLIVAGLQLPVIRLLEVVGNTGAALLRHNGPIGSKLDTTELAMVMSTDTAVAHCPIAGVKV